MDILAHLLDGYDLRSIARRSTHQYLTYSEADFQVFRPAGATRCTDGVKFGTEEETVPNFSPIGATIMV